MMTFNPMIEARDIVENYEFQLQYPKEDRFGELRENIAQALTKAYAEGVVDSAKVAEDAWIGQVGEIRCSEIAQAIRNLPRG